MIIWTSEIKELERLHEALKGRFPNLEKELGQLIRSDDPNVILLYSRRCLEVIITDLCECELKRPRKTEPLKGIIDKLHKEEKVPSHIITSMHGLNDLSTYGAHPKDFDPEQVKPVLVNLDIIIKWYLRYKGLGEEITAQTIKEPIHDIKKTTKEGKRRLIQKNKPFIYISSGIILVILIATAVLYFNHTLGGGRLAKGLEKSIAVLPFINDSPNDSNQYFINGFMEDVLDHLQTIKDLHPISRTSAEKYRKTTKSIPEIAKELGVNYIVEGDMQRYGNSIRLSVNLFKAINKELKLWGKSYEQKISDATDIFSLQSQIAQSIAKELEAVITRHEKQIIEKAPTADLAAYEAYLQGIFYYRKFTLLNEEIALQYFEQAIQKDPKYALAYVGICKVWQFRMNASFASPSEATPKIMTALTKALELDSTRSEVYVALEEVKTYEMWDLKGAESAIKKAIALNPNNSDAYCMYEEILIITGRIKEAMEQVELALKLDPLDPLFKAEYGLTLFFSRRYEDAIMTFQEILKTDPANQLALESLPGAFHQLGRYKEEMEAWKSFYSIIFKDFASVFDQAYSKAGYVVALNLEADTLDVQSKTKNINPWEIALIYSCAGNKERALDMLERGYEVHDPNMVFMLYPVFDILRNEPRFQELARKLKVPYK